MYDRELLDALLSLYEQTAIVRSHNKNYKSDGSYVDVLQFIKTMIHEFVVNACMQAKK